MLGSIYNYKTDQLGSVEHLALSCFNNAMKTISSLADRREKMAKIKVQVNPLNCLNYLLSATSDIDVLLKLRKVNHHSSPAT